MTCPVEQLQNSVCSGEERGRGLGLNLSDCNRVKSFRGFTPTGEALGKPVPHLLPSHRGGVGGNNNEGSEWHARPRSRLGFR